MRDPGNLDETVSGVRDGDLIDLLARVESATKPNFELECALFEALALPTEWFGSKVTSHFRVGGGYGFNTEDGFRHLDCVQAPAYTASLDASLGLVERLFPGSSVSVDKSRHGSGMAAVNLTKLSHAEGATPALALLAALLKALIAQAADTSARNVPAGEGSANASRAATGPLPRIAPDAEPSAEVKP